MVSQMVSIRKLAGLSCQGFTIVTGSGIIDSVIMRKMMMYFGKQSAYIGGMHI